MLRGFENIFVGDDVYIQRSGSPLMQSDTSVKIFDSRDLFEQLLWPKLSCNFDYAVQISWLRLIKT